MTTVNSIMAKTIDAAIDDGDPANNVLTISFSNGKLLTINARDIPAHIATQCLMHGLKQKLVDAAAISRNPETGRSASVEDKYQAVTAVANRILEGQWNKPRGDGSGASGGLLFRALCQIYADKTPETIREFLDKKTTAEKAALRAASKIAAVIETLRVEKAGDSTDADRLLSGLN